MKLSDYIKNYRKENNLSQTDLANLLYVSKQAVSKWENDKALPDVTMYPVISELLKVSVDELMGLKQNKQIINKNKMILITFICLIILALITVVIIKISKKAEQKEIIKESETYLKTDLPKIEEYSFIDFTDFISFNNVIYPQTMYQFVFKDEVLIINESWVTMLDENIIATFPQMMKIYINEFDYFKLIDKDTNEINTIPNPNDNIYTRYVLYCIDIENNRLIIINFEV